MTPAVLRIDSWDFPLFLHVLGATVLFGGMLATTVLSVTARHSQHQALLARYTFRTLLFLVLPAWILTRVAAQWILNRENNLIPNLDNKGWVGVGFTVTEGGLILLVITGFLAWRYARKGGWAGTAVVVLSGLYLVALAVAWYAMSAKPGA
jgi:hypothetical protein